MRQQMYRLLILPAIASLVIATGCDQIRSFFASGPPDLCPAVPPPSPSPNMSMVTKLPWMSTPLVFGIPTAQPIPGQGGRGVPSVATAMTPQQLQALGDTMHMTSPLLGAFAAVNNWCTAQVPEYQDTQRFISERRLYGPVSQVVASPHLRDFTSTAQFDGVSRHVAIVDVWDTIPVGTSSYSRLHLAMGLNCVYLKHTPPSTWTAQIAPPTDKFACPGPAGAAEVAVAPDDSTEPPGKVPPVTRWVQSGDTLVYIGVRCGNLWCNIGAAAPPAVVAPLHVGVAGDPGTPQSRVKGWFDEQELGVTASGVPPLRPTRFATVIPASNLQDIKSFERPRPVASVYFSETVPDYARKFGFAKGWSQIRIMGLTTSREWEAEITDPSGRIHKRKVLRTPHTIGSVPGSARWAWIAHDRDEWIWIACELGCCLIEAGDG